MKIFCTKKNCMENFRYENIPNYGIRGLIQDLLVNGESINLIEKVMPLE